MKVYTKVKTHYNHSDVGIVLLSDKNDIYLQEGTFLITGSLYFISEVRKYLLQKIHSKY